MNKIEEIDDTDIQYEKGHQQVDILCLKVNELVRAVNEIMERFHPAALDDQKSRDDSEGKF